MERSRLFGANGFWESRTELDLKAHSVTVTLGAEALVIAEAGTDPGYLVFNRVENFELGQN